MTQQLSVISDDTRRHNNTSGYRLIRVHNNFGLGITYFISVPFDPTFRHSDYFGYSNNTSSGRQLNRGVYKSADVSPADTTALDLITRRNSTSPIVCKWTTALDRTKTTGHRRESGYNMHCMRK